MKFTEEAVMHIHGRIPVGLHLVRTCPATEQLAPSSDDADGAFSRKPFSFGSTS